MSAPVSLAALRDGPFALPDALDLAIGITDELARLHARGLLHLSLEPSAILVDAASKAVQLGAGRTALGYVAPEQTGRMNRAVDARSDLYSLGVVLYELLTGELPFKAQDPAELVHCHVARRPVPPHERSVRVPRALSAIVTRLLEKLGEDRYQTAEGLLADLQHCRRSLDSDGGVPEFLLATQDPARRFAIPGKLYGRAHELRHLVEAFATVIDSGRAGLVLVSGDSGIGKSSLVAELRRTLLPSTARFASGKVDQHSRGVPYAPLAQAFAQLVSAMLAVPQADLARQRTAIQEATEPHGQLMIDLVPDLERVIGKQRGRLDLAPTDVPSVFERVVRRFLGVLARPEHPLVLFLDDLQWADPATLDLVQHLLSGDAVPSLLVVGAHRVDEVGPDHPLTSCLAAIRTGGAFVHETRLEPLGLADVAQLVSESLGDALAPLARLVHEKTAGNPFFAAQFLEAIADDGLVHFDPALRRWTCDLEGIARRGITDNVVALMTDRIGRLPSRCRDAMKIMACLGNVALEEALAAALDTTIAEVHETLDPAVSVGLLTRRAEGYAFAHDRIQEASYALLPVTARAATHLGIGRRLVARTSLDRLEENVFAIVDQLNRGVDRVDDVDERDRIAGLNLRAGARAKATAAYVTALECFRTATRILGEDRWPRQRALSFALALEEGRCEFLTGALADAEARLSALVAHAEGPVELAAVACERIALHFFRGEAALAVGVCVAFLERDGGRFDPHPTQADVAAELAALWAAVGDRTIEDLAHLPPMTDPATLATLEVLSVLAGPAWFFDALLPGLIAARIVRLSVEHGNSPTSSFGYVILGTKLGTITGEYDKAHRLGTMAVALAERTSEPHILGHVLNAYGMFVRPWAHGLDGCREIMNRSFSISARAGDLTYSAYTLLVLATLTLFDGSSLDDAQAACERSLEYARKHHFQFNVLCSAGQTALTDVLRGGGSDIDDPEFARLRGDDPELTFPTGWYWVYRQQAMFLTGDIQRSVEAADLAAPRMWVTQEFLEFAEHHFYAALARAAHLETVGEAERPRLRERLEENLRVIVSASRHSKAAFGSRAALAAAEVARVDGRDDEAMRLYETAIGSAREGGFVQIEALAFELAARFHAGLGLATTASLQRREARRCYQRWGAHACVRRLEDLFPELREEPVSPGAGGARADLLDLATVLKISRAVSGELLLPNLVDTLMRTALEHAGATRGLLVLAANDELRVEAEATTSGTAVQVRLREGPREPSAALPVTLLRHVIRSRAAVIVEDAVTTPPLPADRYFAERGARAVVCLPLIDPKRVVGALYLENELAPQTFTATRVAVLELLASQAAMSLENTRLYANLEEREARMRQAQADLAHATRVTTLGELAGSLAHEVKQPLAGAVMNAAACIRWLARDVPDLSMVDAAASLTSRDVNRAADIVGRIESLFRKRELPHAPVDLREQIELLIEILGTEADRHAATIRTDLAPQLTPIMADRVQIQQVLLNLIVNALEAMSDVPGPRDVIVTARPRGDEVLVSVSDTGKGFAESDGGRIFEAFFTTKSEGTGLGLSVSRSIVEAHGGRLEARNNRGVGATFELTLPARAHAAERSEGDERSAARTGAPARA